MRFNIAALGLLLTGALAQDITKDFDSVFQPEEDQVVMVGSTVEIAWNINNTGKYGDVKVDVQVLGGKDPSTLLLKDTIATEIDNSVCKYMWHVDSSLGDEKQYGIRIVLTSDKGVLAYSPRFTIEEGKNSGSTTTASTESAISIGSSTRSTGNSTTKTTASKETAAASSDHKTASTSTMDANIPTMSTPASSPTPSLSAAGGVTAAASAMAVAVGCVALMAI